MEELTTTEWNSDSMVSATMGRVMSALLSVRPKKLEDSISRLSSAPKSIPLAVSLEDSLWVLHNYVKDAALKEESLDQVLIPMIEHSLKCKEAKHKNQEMVLLNWLFQDELLFQAFARNFTSILLRKDDRHIALGWCILARGLVEFEVTLKQFTTSGVKERYDALLKTICSCTIHLLSIVSNGSKLQGGFELPTRLSVAAADCVISLTVALTRKDIGSDSCKERTKASVPFAQALEDSSLPSAIYPRRVQASSQSSELSSQMEMQVLLWGLLDELIIFVHRLIAWSRKSRSLHAKGLERVLKWLYQTKEQAGSQMTKTGVRLLSSCWKHYGILLHLEHHQISRQLLEQYLSGIQFYADKDIEKQAEIEENGLETIVFFLNCILLLLGRFTGKQFDSAMAEYRLQISRVVTSQLYSADEDVIDGAIAILKATLFGTDYSSSRCSLRDTRQMDLALPVLLNLLDERDGVARAVVTLLAEYCSVSSDSHCLEEVLNRLATGNFISRRNAIDVVSELIHILLYSVSVLPHSSWQNIANHLLKCLGDEEVGIRTQVVNLMSMIEPSLVLPALVRLIYSSDEKVQASASNALVAMLKYHTEAEYMCMLLDCLSNLNETINLPKCTDSRKEEPKMDVDKVLKLIPEWSKGVKDWTLLVGPLVDKMFAEPSNATIVRFLSCISEHLSGAAHIVFERVMLHAKGNKEIDESLFTELENGTDLVEDGRLQHSLFDRLCPLLIIRLLPLRVFNDLKSPIVYAELVNQPIELEKKLFNIEEATCIVELLLSRAFNKFEFEDVRKLSAELCGRIHPQVLLPVLSSQLEYASNAHDILKIKTCLFSICTSLVVRGRDSVYHPAMPLLRKSIDRILLWPSIDGDEISKAQHGCIDCLALMMCTELQNPESRRDSALEANNGGKKMSKWFLIFPYYKCSNNFFVSKAQHGCIDCLALMMCTELQNPESRRDSALEANNGDAAVCTYVINQLTRDRNEVIYSKLDVDNPLLEGTAPLSFRLCMANALISACQKISDSGREPFVQKILPQLIHSARKIKESEIRSACIQVLFAVVYHLKSAILPYSSDLLTLSVKFLQGRTEKERMAGGRLMAALMANERCIIESISEGLLEARTLLSCISSSDPSPDLRQLCTKLLLCLTSP